MADTTQLARPIAAGFADAIQVTVITETGAPTFPEGCTLRASFREMPGADPLATITTEGGGISRVSDATVLLTPSGAATLRFPIGFVWVDFVRTDLAPERWIDVQLRLPVVSPITGPRA